VFNGEEDHLLQLLLCLLKSTNILPFYIGNFNVSLTERSGIDTTHGEFEVLLSDSHSLQDLGVDFLGLDVNNVHLLSDALQCRFSAKRSNV